MTIPPWLDEHCQRLLNNDVHLKNLNLNIRRLNEEYCNALSQSLVHNHVLEVLNLVSAITQTNAETAIIEVLPQTKLNKLFLSYNRIQNVGASSLGVALQAPTITIQELHLDYNKITCDGATSLANGLMENKTLKLLQLNCNEIGQDGTISLGRMLTNNVTLQKLYLNRNRITPHGAIALWDSLQTNVTLQELDLVQNRQVPSTTMEKIAFMTRANQCGRYLLRMNDSSQALPIGLWSYVLANVNDNPDMLFFFLSAQPELFQSR